VKISKVALVVLLAIGILATSVYRGQSTEERVEEKPVIVCTTSVLGSIVREFMGEEANVTILVNPSLCPADYDMKPGDIYALSIAKILFYHDIPGEKPWLGKLIEASGNTGLKMIKVPGTYNTPEGAKSCIRIIGGNLSEILQVDLSDKISQMTADIDSVANEIRAEAQALGVSDVNVICMNWQKTFVEWVGFKVVATYNPPETLSLGDIQKLINTANENGVALIVDNLQVSAEFGSEIASETGAVHVVLTNFPGALPEAKNLAEMFRYNARRLFDGLMKWKIMKEASALRAENDNLKNQLLAHQTATAAITIVAIVELALLLMKTRGRAK